MISRLQAKNSSIGVLIDRTMKGGGKGSDREKQLERLMEDIKINLVLVTSPKKQAGIDSQ